MTKNRTERQWLSYYVLHPFAGFEDMHWKKSGSVWIMGLILLFWMLGTVLYDRWYGMQFVPKPEETFRILPYFVQTVGVFLAWTVGNWAVCTLLDGIGNLRQIGIFTAYALVPYVVQLYVQVLLSHVLVRDEAVLLELAAVVGTLWSVLLVVTAVRTVHQYSVPKTVLAIGLTLVMMVLLLLLLVVLAALFQQIWAFFTAIYTELRYRWHIG